MTAVFVDPDTAGRVTADAWSALADLVAAFGQPPTRGRQSWSWPELGTRPAFGLSIADGLRFEVKAWVGGRVVRIEDVGRPQAADLTTVLACAGAYDLAGNVP